MYPKELIQKGSRFIDLNRSYEESTLMSAGNDPNNDNKFVVFWYNFPAPPTTIEFKDFDGEFFPDFLCQWNKIDGRFKELRKIHYQSLKHIVQWIYKAEYKKIEIKEILNYYISNHQVSQEEAEALVKLAISTGDLKFEKQKGGDFIKIPKVFLENENHKRFLQSIADEVISKSQRVEYLIHHNQTKGNYRETLLRAVLKKYIPNKYEVATGFIEGCNRQCDILIYDSHNFSPFFKEDDLVVVPRNSVRAVIEVKSTLYTQELQEAMDLLHEVARHHNTPAPIFKGIFAFKNGYESENSIAQAISNFYHFENEVTKISNDISYLYETINAVCVLNEQCIISEVFDPHFKDETIRPRLFSIHSSNKDLKVQTSSFFNELFYFLDVEKYSKKTNISYFRALDNDVLYKLELELYGKDWKPHVTFENEHQYTFETIWERVSDIINWKMGVYSIQELTSKYFQEDFNPLNHLTEFQKRKK